MPYTPYTISGYVYNTDGVTAVSGATVTATNERTKAIVSTTSSALGVYILDLANLSGGYINGDSITVEAVKTSRMVQYSTTVDTGAGSETKNLTLTYYDVLGIIVDTLSDNWNAANTDGITPTVSMVFENKRVDLANNDIIVVYELDETGGPSGLGGLEFDEFNDVSIDIRTSDQRNLTIQEGRRHFKRVQREVKRIMESKITTIATGYQLTYLNKGRDLSDKMTRLWRMVMDCKLHKWATSNS